VDTLLNVCICFQIWGGADKSILWLSKPELKKKIFPAGKKKCSVETLACVKLFLRPIVDFAHTQESAEVPLSVDRTTPQEPD
jgi:hypothetical protein